MAINNVKIFKLNRNQLTKELEKVDEKTEKMTTCVSCGSPEFTKNGKGWIVIHNTDSKNQAIKTVIAAGDKGGVDKDTGAQFYIDDKGFIYQVHDPLKESVHHCGTTPIPFSKCSSSLKRVSNDLLDDSIQKELNKSSGGDRIFDFYSVGIECQTSGFTELNDEQLQSLVYLCEYLCKLMPQLSNGGITCHGNVLPNNTENWGTKKNCGVLPLNQLKNRTRNLPYANIKPAPSNYEDAVKLITKKDGVSETDSEKSVAFSNKDFEEVFSSNV